MNFKFSIFIFLNFLINLINAQLNDLVTIIIITKHNEKGVEISYPNDPYVNNIKIWKNGLNHLTEKGKQDSIAFGKLLKERYGQYFKKKSEDLFAILDDNSYSYETAHNILESMFGTVNQKSIVSDSNHNDILNGPKNCKVLNRRLRRIIRSSDIKDLFKQNKELIQNVTGINKNDQSLVKKIPAIYESIETELNNYLQQPTWLNETTINELKEITINLDKEYYSKNQILELQIGQLLKEIRANLIDNTLKRPNHRLSDIKFGYMYIVNSNQFSALSNILNIDESRHKFGSSYIIELDNQSNLKIYLYDSNIRKLNEKQLLKCDLQLKQQCKMIPFLKNYLDKLISVNYDKACKLDLTNVKIQPNYDEIFKNNDEFNLDRLEDENDLNDNDDLNIIKKEMKEKKLNNIKKFVNEEFSLMINKDKQLIAFLSDLWEKKAEIRKKENNRKEFDSEDAIRSRFISVLKERISKIDNQKESQQLMEILTKWQNDNVKLQSKKLLDDDNIENTVIENFENKIKSSIRDKEITRQQQKTKLIKLVDQIKQFSKLNSLQRTEKADNFKQEINKTIQDIKIKFNEKLDELKVNIISLLEDKFDQIDSNFDQNKLKNTLNELVIKLNDQMEEHKSKRELKLNKIKDRMIRLINDDDLNENEKELKLNEIKQLINNNLDNENKTIEINNTNSNYLKLNNIIQQIPNTNTIEFDQIDEETNDEQIKIEKIKEKLKLIEKDIVDYLELNKDNREDIEENLAKFNNYLQLNKKISTSLLVKLARLIDNEEIKEEIKEVIKDIVNFAKISNHNLLDIEIDLMTLINEIESKYFKVSNNQYNLDSYQNKNLNINKPYSRLLLRESNQQNTESVFNPKAFGLAVAVFFGTMILIGLSIVACKRIRRRSNYERV